MAELIQKQDTLNEGRVKLNAAITDAEQAKVTAGEADSKATQALANSENTQTQLDTIVIEGDSSVEAAQARVDENGVGHTTLKDRIDDGFTKVTSQLNEESNENPIFRNGKEDLPQLGNELINDATVNLGSGWAGNATSGFTHSKGSTDLLELTILSLKANTIYNVEVNITNPAEVDNGQSDYWLTLGGSNEFETYKGRTNRVVWGIKTINGDKLIIRPYEEYSGTITLSVKEVLTRIEPYAVYEDSQSGRTSEARYSDADIGSIYLGKNSGSYANEFAEQNVVVGNGAGENITSGFWNVLIGQEAGAWNTVGTRNVANGRWALRQNVSGDRNVALGSWALMRNSSGRANIGIGADALYYNDNGSNNIGIGLVAIGQNTSGNNNIGIGERVMSGSVGGEYNFAVGKYAMYYNQGNNNTSIGYQSMYQNRVGSDNIAIGMQALMINKNGNHNIALGRHAARNTESNNNIAIGNQTLFDNVNSMYNVAVGAFSLKKLIEGHYNIALGYSAMENVTNGEDNISLGRFAGREGDGNYNIAIGSNAANKAEGERNVTIGFNANVALTQGDKNVSIGSNAGRTSATGDNNILIGYDVNKSFTTASNELNIGNVIKSKDMTTGIVELQKLQLTNLPTSAPSESGMVWNDNGTLKISA